MKFRSLFCSQIHLFLKWHRGGVRHQYRAGSKRVTCFYLLYMPYRIVQKHLKLAKVDN